MCFDQSKVTKNTKLFLFRSSACRINIFFLNYNYKYLLQLPRFSNDLNHTILHASLVSLLQQNEDLF